MITLHRSFADSMPEFPLVEAGPTWLLHSPSDLNSPNSGASRYRYRDRYRYRPTREAAKLPIAIPRAVAIGGEHPATRTLPPDERNGLRRVRLVRRCEHDISICEYRPKATTPKPSSSSSPTADSKRSCPRDRSPPPATNSGLTSRGALVLPGVIDGHVHFDDPGFTQREDFASGTSAAAAGGVTCVVDMPCTSLPPVSPPRPSKTSSRSSGPRRTSTTCSGAGSPATQSRISSGAQHLADLVDAGVAAIKVYMLSGMDTFRDLTTSEFREVSDPDSQARNPGRCPRRGPLTGRRTHRAGQESR